MNELVRQKDFNRDSAVHMSDAEVSLYVCNMAKTSILTQYENEMKYRRESSFDRPNAPSLADSFTPPFGDPLKKFDESAGSTKNRPLDLYDMDGANVDNFKSSSGTKPFYEGKVSSVRNVNKEKPYR
tara:strand:- start:68 stop:448 length:381 start_codon:yes stop_codon:yes gene_type:complete